MRQRIGSVLCDGSIPILQPLQQIRDDRIECRKSVFCNTRNSIYVVFVLRNTSSVIKVTVHVCLSGMNA